MDQRLAEPRRALRINTQQYKIQQIWKGLKKTEWSKETDKDKKTSLKGELYTKISKLYQEQEGTPVKRSTIRRCVNSLIKQAK